MAESVGDLIATIVKKQCNSTNCPYRYGDSKVIEKKLAEQIQQKIKHRLADGNDVRVLEKRVAELEKSLHMVLSHNGKLGKKELESIKKVLAPSKK